MSQVNPKPGILLYTRIKKSPYYYGSAAPRRRAVQCLQPLFTSPATLRAIRSRCGVLQREILSKASP